MDFQTACVVFKNKLTELLDADEKQPIDASHVKTASKILNCFAKFRLDQENLRPFLQEVPKYFLLVVKYTQNMSSSMQKSDITVRMALNMFLFVVDTTNSYNNVFKKMVKIINKVVEIHGDLACIKEFLQVYAGLFKGVSSSVVTRIDSKLNRTLVSHLYDIIKKTTDVEIQAVISEIFLRYINFKVFQPKFFERVFPNIGRIGEINENNIYSAVRFLINDFNRHSSRLFSIECRHITLDRVPVTQHDGAALWLDIELEEGRLSFFCSPTFLASCSSVKMSTFMQCAALSFQAHAVLKINYNLDNGLELAMKIKSSSFSLFSNVQFDTIRELVVTVSKDTDKYAQLVNSVLPKLFPDVFHSEHVANELITLDNSSVRESESCSSSPLIERFALANPRKRVSVPNWQKPQVEPIPVIELTSDEEDEPKRKISTRLVDRNCNTVRMSDMEVKGTLNHSITPISFTESMVGSRNAKISTTVNSVATRNDEGTSRKMSTNLTSFVVSTPSATPVHNPSDSLKASNGGKFKSPIVYMNERLSCELSKGQSPNVKVKNWLQSVEMDRIEEVEQPLASTSSKTALSEEMHGEMNNLLSVSNIGVEERLHELFGGSEREVVAPPPDGGVVDKGDAVRTVLNMMLTPLQSQNEPSKEMETDDNREKPLTSKILNKSNGSEEMTTSESKKHGKKSKSLKDSTKSFKLKRRKSHPRRIESSDSDYETANQDKNISLQVTRRPQLKKPKTNLRASKKTKNKGREKSPDSSDTMSGLDDDQAISRYSLSSRDSKLSPKVSGKNLNTKTRDTKKKRKSVHDSSNDDLKKPRKLPTDCKFGLTRKSVVGSDSLSSSGNGSKSKKFSANNVSLRNQLGRNSRSRNQDLSHTVVSNEAEHGGGMNASSSSHNSSLNRRTAKGKNDDSLEEAVNAFDALFHQDVTNTSQLNTSVAKKKRKLYNPTDLSYLDAMMNDDSFVAQAQHKAKVLNEVFNKKKGSSVRKSTETKPRAYKIKSEESKRKSLGRVSFKTKTKPPQTELTFTKVLTDVKKQLRKDNKRAKKARKVQSLRRLKPLTKIHSEEISSPSTPPLSDPLFEGCSRPKRSKYESLSNYGSSSKRMKLEEVSNVKDSPRTSINVISNVLVKPANHKCVCCEMSTSMLIIFLNFIKHLITFCPDMLATDGAREMYRLLRGHFG